MASKTHHGQDMVRLTMRAAVLSVSVFGASLMFPGRPLAQTASPSLPAIAAGLPGLTLNMSPQIRAQVQSALQGMSNRDLSLTYLRIHETFRIYLGHDDLSVARALIDYAALTESELARRGLPRPEGTEGASEMNLAYELVL
jgi:hypothetical protein